MIFCRRLLFQINNKDKFFWTEIFVATVVLVVMILPLANGGDVPHRGLQNILRVCLVGRRPRRHGHNT